MTTPAAAGRPLRIGFIGSGFIAHFHLTSFEGVRDAVIAGVTSPTPAHREAFAARACAMGLGPCRAYPDIESMVIEGEIDAVWVLNPNDTRIETFATLVRAAQHPRSHLRKATRPHPRRGARGAATDRKRGAAAWLSRKPAVLDRSRARQGHHLGPRRAGIGPSLSCPRGRRARRPARTVVLGRQTAGRRRDVGHDVPFGRSRPPPSDRPRRPARQPSRHRGQRHNRPPQIRTPRRRRRSTPSSPSRSPSAA